MKKPLFGLALLCLGACSAADPAEPASNEHGEAPDHKLPAGSNLMLRAPITISDGLEVIVSDVIIPPNATVPRHYHPGEEFVYVIEGYAVHVEQDKPDRILKAGDAYVIPPNAEHAPRGGPDGARAIVFRVHVAGKPERVLVED